MAYRGPEIKPVMDQLTAEQKREIEMLMKEHRITCWHEGITRWSRAKGYVPGRLTRDGEQKVRDVPDFGQAH